MKTIVTRYFETLESFNHSLKEFKDSGFFTHHETKKVGDYTILHGESDKDLFTMKTKFADAVEMN